MLDCAIVVAFDSREKSFNRNSLPLCGYWFVSLPTGGGWETAEDGENIVSSLCRTKILLSVDFKSRVLLVNVARNAADMNDGVVLEVEILR